MISIIKFKNLNKIMFEKIKKSEKSKIEKELDELEFKQLIREKEKKSEPDEEQLRKLFAHYKTEWMRYEDWNLKDWKTKILLY